MKSLESTHCKDKVTFLVGPISTPHVVSTRVDHQLYCKNMVSTSTDKDTFVLNLRQHEGTLVSRELATRVYNYNVVHGALLLSLMMVQIGFLGCIYI